MGFNVESKFAAVLFLTLASGMSAAPRLGLSTNSVGTVNITTGANGPTQTVQAFNLGDGSLNLTATTSAPWLGATVGSKVTCSQPGGNCYPVSITLNTSALPAGTYTEYVTLTDPNAIDSPQDIAVTVNTTGVPSSITAYVTPTGSQASTTIFPVYTTGTGVKGTVATQSGGNWLQFISGANGLVASPSPFLIQVAAQVGQAPGTYTGSVTISGSSVPSDNKTITVTMVVTTSPIIQLSNSATRLTGYPGGPIQYSFVTLNNLSSAGLAVSSAASSAKFLSATVQGSNTLLIAADPTGLTAGVYSGAITVSSNAANNAQISIPVELLVTPAGQPLILTGGVVNIATGAQEAVSQGDIAAIYGNQLAPTGTSATNNGPPPLAMTLAGVQVLVNGTAVPLYFVSPGQINFQVPYSLTAGQAATVQVVSNGMAGNIRPLNINATVPRLLFFVSFIQGTYGIIVNNLDGSLALPTGTAVPGFTTHPAKPGDVLTIYGIGFGQTNPSAVEGMPANISPLQSIPKVTATFGGGFQGRPTTATAPFAGLTPTAVGLYQINIAVPADSPLGNAVPVSAAVNGVLTNSVSVAVSATGK